MQKIFKWICGGLLAANIMIQVVYAAEGPVYEIGGSCLDCHQGNEPPKYEVTFVLFNVGNTTLSNFTSVDIKLMDEAGKIIVEENLPQKAIQNIRLAPGESVKLKVSATQKGSLPSSGQFREEYGAKFDWSSPVDLGKEVKIYRKGKKIPIDVEPRMINGRTMIPLSAVSREIGYPCIYNAKEKSVTIKNGNSSLVLTIGQKTAIWNEKTELSLDVAPQIIQGRTMVPISFVCRTFGIPASWGEKTKMIVLYKE